MNRDWAGAQVLLLLLAGCATVAPAPDRFTFAVLGDMGYSAAEEPQYAETLRRIDAASPAFAVHVGDFKGGGECSDALFLMRRAQFDAMSIPVVFTPGDNEWTECRMRRMGSRDAIERLKRLREIFFSMPVSLGNRPMPTAVQSQCIAPSHDCGCAPHPENRRWIRSRVVFATLNIPGANNNVGFDAASDEEARCRNVANREWLEAAAVEAMDEKIRALVVIAHANPWETGAAKRSPAYDGFLDQMATLPGHVRKPILFVHGDTHTFRVTDFLDARGQKVHGITRMETHGTPAIGWVLVTVEPNRPDPFRFDARIVGLAPP